MARRHLAYAQPPITAIAANATTPVGSPGDEVWSTAAGAILTWDGSKWAPPASSGLATSAVAGVAHAGKVAVADAPGLLLFELYDGRYPLAAMVDPGIRDDYLVALKLGGVPFLTHLNPDNVNQNQAQGRVYQPAFFSSRLRGWHATPGSATGATENAVMVFYGSVSARAIEPAQITSHRSLPRIGYSTTAAVNQTAGMWSTVQGHHTRSQGPEHAGGLFMHARVGFPSGIPAGARLFIGWAAGAVTLDVDPSSLSNICGYILDAADSFIQFIGKSGATGTKVATTYARGTPSTYAMDFAVGVPAGATVAEGSFRRHIGQSAFYLSHVATHAPAVSQWMFPVVVFGSGTVAQSVTIDVTHLYTDSDL